jgi:hypothetical protein
MVKLGVLYLNKGLWKGERIVSEEWIDISLEKGYGFSKLKNGWYGKGGMIGQFLIFNFEENKAIAEAKAELKTLAKKLEEKNVAYTQLLNKRYNSSFEPTEQDTIFQYTNRNGSTFYFDASTGLPTSDIDNTIEITLDTKSGEVSYVAGYCLKEGAVLVKNYKYSIPSDNSKINLKLLSEVLVPMFSDTAFISELNTTSFSEVEEKEYSNRIVNHALGFISATEFISKFYGINKKFNFSLGAMKTYTKYNKSFEIIIRTCEDSEIMSLLLNKTVDKAVPIHEVIGTTKECLKYAESLGLANKFIRLKNRFATEGFYSSNDFKTILNKTKNRRNENENKENFRSADLPDADGCYCVVLLRSCGGQR